PLVNIRAGLLNQINLGLMSISQAESEFTQQRSIHYTERVIIPGYAIDQKRIDAVNLVNSFRDLEHSSAQKPSVEWISSIFKSTMERERRVKHNGATITLQHIDSYISLHSLDKDQILWDAKNRSVCLMLADFLSVTISEQDVELEWSSFCARNKLDTWDLFIKWL